ncbi:hypothetical protein [Nocardia vermiculata]|uniref:Spore-associated protein A n=1 Tax=Nocardia vermiculata TaxID=257274 RepID=A0A846YBX5_9NOCA|nr:hypothetical protein [Nocardia vermiculata]NKY54289.1 hypothetical protein [Nocardia vermiculata]
MRLLEYGAKLGLAVAAILAGSMAVAVPANAVATPAEACGSNYREIDHHDLPGARIHLLYNGSTNCVVTTRNNPGTKVMMAASLSSETHTAAIVDKGMYAYYAGPVRLAAKGVCIQWGGFTDPGWQGWFSKIEHCG